MKKAFYFTIMTAALILAWGCGSDDDDIIDNPTPTPNQETKWTQETQAFPLQVDWSGNDPVPEWTDTTMRPSPSDYENWMILMVTLQEELANYANADISAFEGKSVVATGYTIGWYAKNSCVNFVAVSVAEAAN